MFHASARDPVWEYVLTGEAALATFEATEEPIVLVGHSHVALAISLDGDQLEGGVAAGGLEVPLDGARRLFNPGSVGQPRDGDPRAAWLLLDLDAGLRPSAESNTRSRRHSARSATPGYPTRSRNGSRSGH